MGTIAFRVHKCTALLQSSPSMQPPLTVTKLFDCIPLAIVRHSTHQQTTHRRHVNQARAAISTEVATSHQFPAFAIRRPALLTNANPHH